MVDIVNPEIKKKGDGAGGERLCRGYRSGLSQSEKPLNLKRSANDLMPSDLV